MMENLLNKNVTFFCLNYIYYGQVIAINKKTIELKNAHIVYETGCFSENKFKDAQQLNAEIFYLTKSNVESFFIGNKNL